METEEVREWLRKGITALDKGDSEEALKIASQMDEEKRDQLEQGNDLYYNLLDDLSNMIKDRYLR